MTQIVKYRGNINQELQGVYGIGNTMRDTIIHDTVWILRKLRMTDKNHIPRENPFGIWLFWYPATIYSALIPPSRQRGDEASSASKKQTSDAYRSCTKA